MTRWLTSRASALRWFLSLAWLAYRKPHYRPLWPAVVLPNDLLVQADFLCSSGYLVAGGMLSRAFVERTVHRLAVISPWWKEANKMKTVGDFSAFLLQQEVIDEPTSKFIRNVYDRASQVCHTGRVSRNGCRQIVTDCHTLRTRFDAAFRLALSKAE